MFTPIRSNRLNLRLPSLDDAERITELLKDWEMVRMLGRVPWPYTLSDAQSWINNARELANAGSEYPMVIIHHEHGLVGSCGLQNVEAPTPLSLWELGYWIGKPYWGNGYVTEAARTLLDWGENTLNATGYMSGHIEDNHVSGHVLRKLNFEEVGTIEHYVRGRDCIIRAHRFVRNSPAEIALAFNRH